MRVHYAEDGSIPVPDMSALIARLEAAEAGSAELDEAVAVACGSKTQGWAEWASDGTFLGSIRTYSTSLDAALALAERVLPGRVWCLLLGGPQEDSATVDGEPEPISGNARTLPLAVCIAVLKSIPTGYEAAGEVSPNLKAKAQGEGG